MYPQYNLGMSGKIDVVTLVRLKHLLHEYYYNILRRDHITIVISHMMIQYHMMLCVTISSPVGNVTIIRRGTSKDSDYIICLCATVQVYRSHNIGKYILNKYLCCVSNYSN